LEKRIKKEIRVASGKDMSSFPIIHIIGLPGAGKTTLAKKLSSRLNLPVLQIGEYRSRYPPSPIGEADAWVALYRDLSKRKWRNCILETTGLNRRECFLKVAPPFSQIITFKLEAQRKILYQRIDEKKRRERGGKWLFSADYPDKYEFVKNLYSAFRKLPSDIRIDTTKLKPEEVFEIALKKIEKYKLLFS
jgi:hypothetical protein